MKSGCSYATPSALAPSDDLGISKTECRHMLDVITFITALCITSITYVPRKYQENQVNTPGSVWHMFQWISSLWKYGIWHEKQDLKTKISRVLVIITLAAILNFGYKKWPWGVRTSHPTDSLPVGTDLIEITKYFVCHKSSSSPLPVKNLLSPLGHGPNGKYMTGKIFLNFSGKI